MEEKNYRWIREKNEKERKKEARTEVSWKHACGVECR